MMTTTMKLIGKEVLHTKGGYEGVRQVESGQQCAVDQADDGARHQGDDDEKDRICHAALDQHTAHACAECRVSADREVDTCCDQAEQHTC